MRLPPGAWRHALYLAWFFCWCLGAFVLFARGYFLSRRTLPDVSECTPLEQFTCDGRVIVSSDVDASVHSCSDEGKIAAIIARHDSPMVCGPGAGAARVLLVVVDAFRYDFAEYVEGLEKPPAYLNKLPIVRALLAQPNTTRLYRFVADPPTTTLQRLKALATGSLPTFLDAGENFHTTEIQEDNLIDQVVKSGGRAVLLGDDTWARLFPGRWHRQHAHYSFHTWDLDTVDNEVDSVIYSELERDDWQLLVAHYLGVDHAGHRYGPHHPEMSRKLGELNVRLSRLARDLPPDTLLCVVGDHGMTDTGDHGGDSALETEAALLLHAAGGFSWGEPAEAAEAEGRPGARVRQTELAATLAAVLGRAPPAPSLGLLLPTALPAPRWTSWRRTLLAIISNLAQVALYVERYATVSPQLDSSWLQNVARSHGDLRARAANITSERNFQLFTHDARSWTEGVREKCRGVWVEFDSLAMLRGCLLALMAVFLNYLVLEGLPLALLPHLFRGAFVPRAAGAAAALAIAAAAALYAADAAEEVEAVAILVAGLVSTLALSSLVALHWHDVAERWWLARGASLHERLARAALVASAAALTSNSYVIEEGSVCVFLCLGVLAAVCRAAGATRALLLLWVSVGAALAVTRPYRACREEQGACWLAGGAGAGAGAVERSGVLFAMLTLGTTVAAVRYWSRRCGWGGGVAWRYGPAAAAVCVCGHWAAAWGGGGAGAAARRSQALARAAWALLAVLAALLVARRGGGGGGGGGGDVRAALVRACLVLHVAMSLVLGPGAAAPAALLLAAAVFTLDLLARARAHLAAQPAAKNAVAVETVEAAAAVTWALLATYYLYGTGHHATLAHVRWAAAFHAGALDTQRAAPRALAAAFLLLNTFGGALLMGVASPLLVLWGGFGGGRGGGERVLPPPPLPLSTVFAACLRFQLCFAVRVLACMVAATVHSRHLMVWSVFAPKLLYEAGAAAAAALGALAGFLLVLRHSTPAAALSTGAAR